MSKELVKDRVIKYLTEDLFVPMDVIETDVELAEFEEGAEGTMDIVVSTLDNDGYYTPLMVVQCLDEDIEMEGELVEKQVEILEEIDNITNAGRMILTNGSQMMYADWTGNDYDEEADLPTYDKMVAEYRETEEAVKNMECDHEHN